MEKIECADCGTNAECAEDSGGVIARNSTKPNTFRMSV